MLLFGHVATAQPDIYLVKWDDASMEDFGVYDGLTDGVTTYSSDMITPNMDAIAAQGVVFLWYYGEFICMTERMAYHSGRYPCRFGWQARTVVFDDLAGFPFSERTMPEDLKTVGYSNFHVGKWHLDHTVAGHPHNRGFDWSYFFTGGTLPKYPVLGDEDDMHLNGKLAVIEGYADSTMLDAGLDAAAKVSASKPLYFEYDVIPPHGPMTPTADTVSYISIFPDSVRRARGSAMTTTDRQIGRLHAFAQARAATHNRGFVFIINSDNGALTDSLTFGGSNGDRRGQKGRLTEGGIRVPLIIKYSGVFPSNTVNTQRYHVTDVSRYVRWLAGVHESKPLDGVEGSDFHNSVINNVPTARTEMIIAAKNINITTGNPSANAILFLHNNLTWIKALQGADLNFQNNQDGGIWETYDLDLDPNETNPITSGTIYDETLLKIPVAESVCIDEFTTELPVAIPNPWPTGQKGHIHYDRQ